MTKVTISFDIVILIFREAKTLPPIAISFIVVHSRLFSNWMRFYGEEHLYPFQVGIKMVRIQFGPNNLMYCLIHSMPPCSFLKLFAYLIIIFANLIRVNYVGTRAKNKHLPSSKEIIYN